MTKIDNDSMKEIILENNNLSGLKSDMNSLGFGLPEGRKGEKKAYREALKCWRQIREVEFPLSEIPIRKPESLSFTEVKKDDCDFKIYGFIHGTKKKSMSSEFEVLIKNEINNIKNASGEAYTNNESFCEDGFNGIHGYLCESMRDTSFKAALMASLYPLKFFMHDIFTDTEIVLPYAKFETENFQNPSFYEALREVFKRKYLPEPFNTEYFKNDKFFTEITTNRSKYMAIFVDSFHKTWHIESFRQKTVEYDPKKIGLFCGLAHEPQIEYFLKSDFRENEVYPRDLTFYRYEK